MKTLSTLFLLILLTCPKSYAVSDSLRQVVFGVEVNYNVSKLPKRFSNRSGLKPTGNHWGVFGFAEFRVMQRMRLSTGIGLTHLSFSNLNNFDSSANLPQPDTVRHWNFYAVNSKELSILSTLTCRFDYVLNPKIYVILGLKPAFRVSSNETNVYLNTWIRYRERDDENVMLSNPSPAPIYRENFFSLGSEIGVGIEIKNMALEFLFNNTIPREFLFYFLGCRFRYKI